MASRTLVQLTLLVSVVWSGVLADEYQSDHYGEDEYDGGGDERRSHAAPKETGFVQPLDFSPLFQGHAFGLAPLASQPLSAALLQADKSQYPALFDTAVSSSIDLLQPQVAASETVFSPENFGFKPVVSQGFLPPPAQYVQHPVRYQQNAVRAERPQAAAHSAALTHAPLQYNIQTRHDPNYRIYKSQDDVEGTEILAALKQNPAVASYFQPKASNIEIAHPQNYRREGGIDNNQQKQNYRANAYLAGNPSSRTRRYTDGRRQHRRSKHSEDDESPYDYKSEYKARPKEFDSGAYSAYTDGRGEKDGEKEDDYGYDYGGDSGYSNDDYERIKKLSEAQAAEIKENPEHCKEVKKDSMTCMVCKNPKTGGNYESCSYVAEPKNNKYAYSREKKFDSKDQPDEPADDKGSSEESKPAKVQEASSEDESDDDSSKKTESIPKYKSTYRPPSQSYAKYTSEPKQPYQGYKRDPSESPNNAKYTYSPPKSSAYSAEEDEESEEKPESGRKSYDYKAAIPGFYTDNEPKKDVEHVLAEFKKKDRSACKKVHKNGMTCFQCIDANGLKHEECMFVSESAPKRTHLAYQELKEFTSKPATIDGKGNSEAAESQVVTTATPPAQKSAAYVAASSEPYGSKLKRKKVAQGPASAATQPPAKSLPLRSIGATPAYETRTNPTRARVARSSDDKEAIEDVIIPDETSVAPPEEFAGDASKGAFWAETQPRYSKTLGVTLPEFMLSRSEHELSFDETVEGA